MTFYTLEIIFFKAQQHFCPVFKTKIFTVGRNLKSKNHMKFPLLCWNFSGKYPQKI